MRRVNENPVSTHVLLHILKVSSSLLRKGRKHSRAGILAPQSSNAQVLDILARQPLVWPQAFVPSKGKEDELRVRDSPQAFKVFFWKLRLEERIGDLENSNDNY